MNDPQCDKIFRAVPESPLQNMLKHSQSFFDHLCFDKDFDLDTWAQQNQVPPATITHLKSQGEERLAVYRRLVSDGLLTVIRSALPVFCHSVGKDTLSNLLRRFLNDSKTKSRYYRDIPKEFTCYFKNHSFAEPPFSPFLTELADYECADYALIHAEDPTNIPENNPTLLLEEARLFLSPNLRLKTYDWPVHTISQERNPSNLQPSTSHLVLHRAPDYHVHTLSVSKTAYDFLEFFQNHPEKNFRDGLGAVLEKNQAVDSETLTNECLTFLRDLLDKQIVIALY